MTGTTFAAIGAGLAVIGAGLGIGQNRRIGNGCHSKTAGSLLKRYRLAMIIAAALIEGVALFAVVVALIAK